MIKVKSTLQDLKESMYKELNNFNSGVVNAEHVKSNTSVANSICRIQMCEIELMKLTGKD